MKPFNLEKALAGEPVVTRDGRKVTDIHYFSAPAKYKVVAHIVNNSCVDTFEIDGTYLEDSESSTDLFMAERERWINIYWDEYNQKAFSTGSVYATELQAKENGIELNYQTTIKLK